jgi:WD40 repeat protein
VEARFWDLRGRETRPPLAHACIAISVAFSPDGKTLATGHWDRTALLWNLVTEKEPVVLQHEGPVATVGFSHDGKALLTGAFDGAVRIWDTNGRPLGPPLRQGHLVDTAVFDPNDKSILVATRGNVARLWDLAPGAITRSDRSQESASFPLATSSDGRTILTRETEHTTVIRDAATLQPVGASLPHSGPILIGGTSVLPGRRHACSSDRRRALTVDPGDVVKLWDARTGELVAELKTDDEQPIFYTAAFSPDGKLVVTGRDNYSAEVWDAATGTFLRRLPHGPTGGVFAAAFAPDGKTLLTGSADNAASFWNPSTGELLGPPLMHHTVVIAVAYSPDGKAVATGDAEQNVQLWDVSTRARLRHLPGHRGGVNDVTFSPDGRSILTASSDHTARLWDMATGKPIGPPMQHDGPVVRAAFARDGTMIQTATQDQRTFSWRVPLPMEGSTEQVERWAQVETGMELAPDGGTRVLDAATWGSRRQGLKTSD